MLIHPLGEGGGEAPWPHLQGVGRKADQVEIPAHLSLKTQNTNTYYK